MAIKSFETSESIQAELPRTVDLRYWRWPEDEGEIVEFRLIYKGPLSSQQGGGRGGSILKQKHAIRRQFHHQLRELWHTNNFLKRYAALNKVTQPGDTEAKPVPFYDRLAREYAKFGYKFLPLVKNDWGIACALDILFLRRDDPGKLIVDGGDIDNRIKTLFDGLKVPQYPSHVEGMPPQQGEDPFFCLLEDDRLITEIKVTTDRLLLPMEREEQVEDVHLILHVKTKILEPEKSYSVFGHS
jgi:hypothetical protein